jgi:very-short-patch-repair endonuclease
VTVAGYALDAYFPAERVIVELDLFSFHTDPRAFEADRERDAHHLSLGVPTVRLTWRRIHARPHHEAERVARILIARRHEAA